MMSQQQNPPAVSQSQLQEMGSEKPNVEADAKPFSIRQYVLASRRRNILHNWPFPEKYLQIVLNSGLRDVLPPFGQQTSPTESLKGCSNLMDSQDGSKDADELCKTEVPHLNDHPQNMKNESNLFSDGERHKVTNPSQDGPLSHEDLGNQHDCSVNSVNISQSADAFTHPSSIPVHKSGPSSKAKKDKRRRRRGRFKKRSMVDILVVARHCTLEEIYSKNMFCFPETVIEGCQQMLPSENNSKSELTGDDAHRKAGSEDHEVANIDMTGKASLLLKFKLNGCNVNLNSGT